MTRAKTRKTSNPKAPQQRLLILIISMLCCLPTAAFATNFEISRLAAQINLASSQLANELRYARGYGSVRLSADRLSREAEQLVEAIRRSRSNSYVRSQFRDITRRYQDLEKDFLRANRTNHDPRLYNEVSLISNLYTNLSNEIYYTNYVAPYPQSYYYNAPIASGHNGSRSIGGRGFVNQNRQRPQNQGRRDRRDYGQISASHGATNFEQRNSMPNRQVRQNSNRRSIDSNSNRRRGRSTETRRRSN
jgi:hypothetical protein